MMSAEVHGYDVIVVGVGSMGSAAVHTLAARGLSVLGLENFGPAHDQGSAHGGSRIIRQSYFEGPAYVPLLQRAFEGWRELQEQSGRDLLRLCGGIYIGDPDNPVVTGSRAAALIHGLPHEVLDAAESLHCASSDSPQLSGRPFTRRRRPPECTARRYVGVRSRRPVMAPTSSPERDSLRRTLVTARHCSRFDRAGDRLRAPCPACAFGVEVGSPAAGPLRGRIRGRR